MSQLYETILGLCESRNITGYRMCKDLKIQPSIMTDLKMGRKKELSSRTAHKIAQYFGVTVGYLLSEEEYNPSVYCKECGFQYNSADVKEIKQHDDYHLLWENAVDKFGFCWEPIDREEKKADARAIVNDDSQSLEDRVDAQITVFKALFSRSLMHNNFDLSHPDFNSYIAMILWQGKGMHAIPEDVYEILVAKYGTKQGISEGTYYKEKLQDHKTLERKPNRNVIKIAGRDGSFKERVLTDEQLAALAVLIDQLPDVPDDL